MSFVIARTQNEAPVLLEPDKNWVYAYEVGFNQLKNMWVWTRWGDSGPLPGNWFLVG